MSFKRILDSVICSEFEKSVGRWQCKEENAPPTGMLVTFRLSVDYDIEEGYRHLDMLIFAPYNYVGVFARERWNVIKNDHMEYNEEDDESYIKEGYDYVEGSSPWLLEGYHDSCWRDAVDRVIHGNEARIQGLGGSFGDWYQKLEIDKELMARIEVCTHREEGTRYEPKKDVFFFEKNES